MVNPSSSGWAYTCALGLRLSFGFAAGCSAPIEEGELDSTGTIEQSITGWQTLNLLNGWTATSGNAPRVAKAGNVIVFRGSMSGASATNTHAFNLPAGFRTTSPQNFELRVLMGNQKTGRLRHLSTQASELNKIRVVQDGLDVLTLGDGRPFVSLDGVSIDADSSFSQPLTVVQIGDWAPVYGHRANGVDSDPFYVGWIGNQMRLMGAVKAGVGKDESDNYLFQLPSGYRPSRTVYLPVTLGFPGDPSQETGHVRISSGGGMRVFGKSGTMTAANQHVSFENVFWGEQSIKQNLTLVNGWTSGVNNTRTAAVSDFGGYVVLEGGISGGTSTTFATLPSGLRPPTTIYIALTTTTGATPGRLRIDSNGTMRVDIPSLSTAAQFTSLEGVAFGL